MIKLPPTKALELKPESVIRSVRRGMLAGAIFFGCGSLVFQLCGSGVIAFAIIYGPTALLEGLMGIGPPTHDTFNSFSYTYLFVLPVNAAFGAILFGACSFGFTLCRRFAAAALQFIKREDHER